MSLVIGYTDGKQAIIMSDGRAGGTYAPSETYDKTTKINDNIIIGFVGNAAFTEPFLNEMRKQFGEELKDCTIEDIQDFFEFQFTEQLIAQNPASTFLIMAKTENTVKVAIFGQDTGYKFKYINKSTPLYVHIGGCFVDKIIATANKTLSLTSDKSPIEQMEELIIQCSSFDNSINTNVFTKTV